jgi:hypothetical protein
MSSEHNSGVIITCVFVVVLIMIFILCILKVSKSDYGYSDKDEILIRTQLREQSFRRTREDHWPRNDATRLVLGDSSQQLQPLPSNPPSVLSRQLASCQPSTSAPSLASIRPSTSARLFPSAPPSTSVRSFGQTRPSAPVQGLQISNVALLTRSMTRLPTNLTEESPPSYEACLKSSKSFTTL